MLLMAEQSPIWIGVAGTLAMLLVPVACPASSLTVTTVTPPRPQIHLTPSMRMDTRSRDITDPDLSDACQPDDRLRGHKRARRCRQDR